MDYFTAYAPAQDMPRFLEATRCESPDAREVTKHVASRTSIPGAWAMDRGATRSAVTSSVGPSTRPPSAAGSERTRSPTAAAYAMPSAPPSYAASLRCSPSAPGHYLPPPLPLPPFANADDDDDRGVLAYGGMAALSAALPDAPIQFHHEGAEVHQAGWAEAGARVGSIGPHALTPIARSVRICGPSLSPVLHHYDGAPEPPARDAALALIWGDAPDVPHPATAMSPDAAGADCVVRPLGPGHFLHCSGSELDSLMLAALRRPPSQSGAPAAPAARMGPLAQEGGMHMPAALLDGAGPDADLRLRLEALDQRMLIRENDPASIYDVLADREELLAEAERRATSRMHSRFDAAAPELHLLR